MFPPYFFETNVMDLFATTNTTAQATADDVIDTPNPLAALGMTLLEATGTGVTKLATYIYAPNGAEHSVEYWMPPQLV
jgi:hypothetical protein